MRLPIYEAEVEFHEKLRRSNRLIVEAPTGSGKSTQIPQFLLKGGFLENGEAIVLQPRRIAARMLAKRVASELSEPLGHTVGYQVRHESVVSRETRIRFVTEGVLLRRMISDPTLAKVACIIFDEFHERSLNGDLSLARSLSLQEAERSDLKLIVMSATLDTGALENYLSPCSMTRSAGRVYPVAIQYLEAKAANAQTPIWEKAAAQTVAALARQPEGHVLVFMPGAFEISKTLAALRARLSARDFDLMPLHSELSSRDQDRAVEASERRKVIVATNVAETSLTIDNVRVVIDSGQARVARYDPSRGINTLWIEKISDAAANQRSGRAGRTAPGLAIRLWSEREHANRPLFEQPEIARVDLAEMLLSLFATGVSDLERFPWFEIPDPARLKDALALLRSLGAIDEEGALTPKGRKMSSFPLHPRYAAMLIAARDFGRVEEVALICALAQSRGIFMRTFDKATLSRRESLYEGQEASDLLAMARAWEAAAAIRFDRGFCEDHGLHGQTCRQVGQVANQLIQYAEAEGLVSGSPASAEKDAARHCILLGFPDRVCRRMDRGTLRCEMVGQRRGDLARESVIGEAPLFVACEANEIGRQGGAVSTVFNQCTAIERSWLERYFPQDFSDELITEYDERQKRVVERRVVRFQDLLIESKESLEPNPTKAAEALADLVHSGRAGLDRWDEAVESYIRKVNLIASAMPEYGVEPIGEEARRLLVEQCCEGARTLRDLRKREALPVVKEWVGLEVQALVEAELPDRLRLPNGKPANLRVEADGSLTLSAKIQSLYDLEDLPKMCQGRIRPRLELLAPNMRPIQVTDDLKAFWTGSYEAIKKELRGRYPKHEWR